MGSIESGMPSASRRSYWRGMLTQPTPMPSARAASHRFWTAQTVLVL